MTSAKADICELAISDQRFRSVTTPSLASTKRCGSIPNTSCHVPAAAHTSSYCNGSGSMNTRGGVL